VPLCLCGSFIIHNEKAIDKGDGFMRIRPKRTLCCFEDSIGFDTGSANSEALRTAIYLSTNFLEIGHPSPARFVVRMADIVAADRLLPANITHSCHCTYLS
jgi:hypothetical protein